MYSDQRYLMNLTADRPLAGENSNDVSGGLPHSEILGSKPIPGSPRLIAGYRVLPRLLLPRHPPNALLALDPTRGRTGPRTAHPGSRNSSPNPKGRKSYIHPSPPAPTPHTRKAGPARQRSQAHASRASQEPRLVVLDLEQTRCGPRLPAQEPGRSPSGPASGV